MAEQPPRRRVAIVTGAGRGIGQCIATRLLKDGMSVTFSDLSEDAAQAAARQSGAAGRTLGLGGDLAMEINAKRLVEKTVEHFGRVDILVNNAGGGIIRPFLAHTAESLQETINRNLWTAIWCCRHVLPHMKTAAYGRIINIGADSLRNGLIDHAAYNAAKGGVHGMTTGLAREFARDGITVNTVAPCAVNTPQMVAITKRDPALAAKFISVIPMGRPAEMEEVASMVSYLASAEASFVTGQVVNGGSTML